MAKTVWIGDIQDGLHNGQTIELKGWIKRTRGSNKLRFIVLRDSTGDIQCVGKLTDLGEEVFEAMKGALIESSVILNGTVVESEKAPGGHELVAQSFQIVGAVDPERPFPINKEALNVVDEDGEPMPGGSEFLLNHRHLYLRTSRMTTMLKLRSSAFGAIHNYFRNCNRIKYKL